MNRQQAVLYHGTQMRECVLGIFRTHPAEDATAITRRLAYEIGEAVRDLYGPEAAGRVLYAAADAVTARMPLEDFRLPVVAEQHPEAKAADTAPLPDTRKRDLTGAALGKRVASRLIRLVFGPWGIGLATGLWLGWGNP